MTRGEFTPAAAEEGEKRLSQRRRILGVLTELPGTGVRRRYIKLLGGDRFSARINELRADGHRILGPVKAPRWGINERTRPFPDGEDRYLLLVVGEPLPRELVVAPPGQPRCSDCGAEGETSGHMTCAYPENRP